MKGIPRSFLFVALAGMLLAGVVCSVPVVAGPIELTYANFPPAPTFPCVQMERWKVEVENAPRARCS